MPLLARPGDQAAAAIADAALVELGALADPVAATALARLAERTVPDKERRKAARAGRCSACAARACSRSRVEPASPCRCDGPPAARDTLSCRSLASQIDGAGSRALSLYADRPLGGAYLFSLLVNDVEGLKDFFARDSTRKRLAAREDEMREQAGAWVSYRSRTRSGSFRKRWP